MNSTRWAVALALIGLAFRVEPSRSLAAETADQLLRQAQSAFSGGKADEALSLAKKAAEAEPKNPRTHFVLGRILETMHRDADAVSAYSRVIEIDAKSAEPYQTRGWVYFRLGKFKESIADFDAYIERNPGSAPHHWQRGIVLYYAGRFDDGRKQFESHQTVNPSDVENAVWHFLCNVRVNGIEKARAQFIKISGDGRIPMAEVHALFAGTGSEEKVLAAAKAGNPSANDLRQRLFYAHLYLGLYFEALGDPKKTREHIEKSAKDFSENHAMGDVARVHQMVLNGKKSP